MRPGSGEDLDSVCIIFFALPLMGAWCISDFEMYPESSV